MSIADVSPSRTDRQPLEFDMDELGVTRCLHDEVPDGIVPPYRAWVEFASDFRDRCTLFDNGFLTDGSARAVMMLTRFRVAGLTPRCVPIRNASKSIAEAREQFKVAKSVLIGFEGVFSRLQLDDWSGINRGLPQDLEESAKTVQSTWLTLCAAMMGKYPDLFPLRGQHSVRRPSEAIDFHHIARWMSELSARTCLLLSEPTEWEAFDTGMASAHELEPPRRTQVVKSQQLVVQQIVLREGEQLCSRMERLAMAAGAYSTTQGNVKEALVQLNTALDLVGKRRVALSTFYTYLNQLDKLRPGWRASHLLSSQSGNLEGHTHARRRRKRRDNYR